MLYSAKKMTHTLMSYFNSEMVLFWHADQPAGQGRRSAFRGRNQAEIGLTHVWTQITLWALNTEEA